MAHHTESYQIEDFSDLNGIEYATLSHTWEDEGEVLFQDMADLGCAMIKTGWEKVKRTCELARKHDPPIKYAWVDTCCIDKTSSTELSEAINSMFNWYRGSKVCFVYLKGFSQDLTSLPINDPDFETALGQCRWFTRGWTLQELIAPDRTEFYNDTWALIGNKSQLMSRLSGITGINEIVLRDAKNLSTIPVGRRMSWAAKRETKRKEDIAYCLLGIFNVNIPLLYGEGSKAFIRLQEEIARLNNDLTLFAWRQQPEKPLRFRGIFAEGPEEFVGCVDLHTPRRSFGRDTEFSLTNRGLRFESNMLSTGEFWQPKKPVKELILPLDCFLRKEGKIFWTAIKFKQVDHAYVRISPKQLLTDSSPQWRRHCANKHAIFIPRTLSELEVKEIEHSVRSVSVSMVYAEPLWSITKDRLKSTQQLARDGKEVYVGEPFEMACSEEASIRTNTLRISIQKSPVSLFGRSSTDDIYLTILSVVQAPLSSGLDLPEMSVHLFELFEFQNLQGWTRQLPLPNLTEEMQRENIRNYLLDKYMDNEGRFSNTQSATIDFKRGDYTYKFSALVEQPKEDKWGHSLSRDFVIYLSHEKILSS